MSWRYIIVSNFQTQDNSFAPTSLVAQCDDIENEETGMDRESFYAVIEEFVSRRQKNGWGTINIINKGENTIIIDEATTQDLEQFQTEFGGFFSVAKVSKPTLDLFLHFHKGGDVEDMDFAQEEKLLAYLRELAA